MKTAVIMNTAYECDGGGCQYQKACGILRTAEQLQKQVTTSIKGSRMGMALWCEYGDGHPFSEKKDFSTLQRKVTTTNRYDEEVVKVEDIVICANCLGKMYGSPEPSAKPAIAGVSDAVPYQSREDFNRDIQQQNQDGSWRPTI